MAVSSRKGDEMPDYLRLIIDEARQQGFAVFETDDGMLRFQKDHNSLVVRAPGSPLEYMGLIRSLMRMGMTWPSLDA